MSFLNNMPAVDSDFLAVLAEQGINPTYRHNGVISGKNNCGVNFSKLGIETRYDKNQINEKTGNKINPDKELSIFVMVHGGSPIDTKKKNVYNNKEEIRKRIKKEIRKRIKEEIKEEKEIEKQTGWAGGLLDFFYPIKTSTAKYRAFNLCADRIRTYTLMGKNVHFHNEFWRLHYLMYLKEDIITLILIYLAVEFHWISTNKKSENYGNIYPYRKIYSNCPFKRKRRLQRRKNAEIRREAEIRSNAEIRRTAMSRVSPGAMYAGTNKRKYAYVEDSGPQSSNSNSQGNLKIQQIEEGDTSMLDVNIGFGDKELDESYICFMYTEKKKINGQIQRDKNNDIIYDYNIFKINLKETNNHKIGGGLLLHTYNKNNCLYLSDLILYIEEIIKLIGYQDVYRTYDLIYCQGFVDEGEIMSENKNAKYIQRGHKLFTPEEIVQLKNKNKEDLDTKNFFYQKIFNASHHANKGKEINDKMRVLKRNINNDKILNISTTFPDLLQNSNIFKEQKKNLNFKKLNLNIPCPNEDDDFKKMSIILDNITTQKKKQPSRVSEGGKRNKQKGKIKSKPKQEKKKIKSVVVKPKPTTKLNKKEKSKDDKCKNNNQEHKKEEKKTYKCKYNVHIHNIKDGRTGKYKCNGHTHKTKEALNKCKKTQIN